MKHFGWELILDIHSCNESIKMASDLRGYAKNICKVICMKPYGKPIVKHFGTGAKHTEGYTLVQLIETSAISGHFTDNFDTAHINIFSCKDFDYKKATNFTLRYFEAKIRKCRFIERFL